MHHKLCFGSRVWHLAVIAFTVACLQAVSAQVVCTGVDQFIADEVGANWIHVRYTPTDWHPAKDRLDGWSAYGSKGNNSAPWSIQFDNMDFGEFLFVSGDCSKWLIASRFDVTGEEYGTALRTAMKSSASSTPYSASWSNRGLQQDPIVKISAAPEDVVYMANAQPSPNTAKVGGFSVYIRGRACPDGYALTYNADNVINRHGCIAGVTCDGVVDSVSGRCWKYFAANGVDHPRQEDAETACETWGGFLASILNPDDRAFADRLMIEHGVEVPQAVWVGLKACPGGWCWSDGTPFSFTQLWDSGFGQPEPRPCAVVWRRQGVPIRMMTRFCDLSIWDEDFWRRYTTAGFLCASPSSGCPDNTYGLGNGNCQLCPAGAISVAGLNKAVYSCLCPAGSALIFGASEAGCVSHPTCRGIFDPVRQRCWRSYAGLEQDWATAESTCQGDGGHLASILTPEDRTVALALYRDAGLSAGSRLWTGLHISSGAWQWSEGSAYSLIFWDGGWGEPRQGGGACAQIWERRPNTGVSMSVMHCESEFGFLCTTAAAACPDGEYGDGLRCQQCPMNGTSTEGRNMHVYNCLCPRGMAMRYTGDAGAAEATCIEHPTCVGLLDVRSNRCWKLFLEEEEWSAAEGSCNSWGGHLASITTSEDRELARELLRSAGTLTGSLLWVGLRITSTWGWSDGSLFSLNLWDGGWGEPISGRSCAMVWERRPGTNVNFGTKNCEMTFSFLCATAAPVCPDNTYGDGRRCIACPGGGTSTAGRNLLVEACVCPTGFALSQAECVVSSWCNGLLAAGRCWGYLHGNQPWETAEMACQAWNHEGHLASMSDSVERATAIQLYKANANVQWDKVWVGLSRLEDPSYWQWADDTPPLWLPWDAGWGQLTINKPCSAAWTRLAQGNAMNLIRLNCDDVSVTGSLCNTPAPTCPADTFGTWPTCVPCPSNSTSAAGRNAAMFGCRCLGGLVMDHFDETCVNVSLCSEGVFDPWEQRCWTALSSNVLTWEAARDACEVWGGDLAPVRTSWELEMAGAIYKSLGNKARNSMWVGARRSQGSVVWTWADGSPHIVNPLTWDSAPASGTSERCGVLWSQGTLALQYSDGEAKLQDLDCEDSHGYVTGALCSTRPLCPDNSFWNSAERSCSLCPNGGTSTQGRNYGVFSCRCPDLQSLAYNNLIEGIFLVECLYEPECSGGVQDVTKGVCVQYTPAEKVATADGPATRRMKVTSGGITLAASLDGCSAQGMMLLDVTGGDETLVLPALLLDAEGLGVGEAVWINGSTEADTCTVLKRDLDGSPVIEELECAAAMAAGYICSRNVAVKNAVAYEVVHSSCPGCTFIKTLTPTQELKPGTLLRQGICDASCSVLDLARKGISAISGAFRDLPNVWSLDLSMNVIRELNSGTFESMTNLVALDVSGNGMYSIELGALGPLSNLEIFWLNNNEVSYFETGLLYPLLKVREMRLAENPFICQPLFPPSLERLDVNFLAASLPNCLPPQCAGQRSAEVFSVKDFRIGARAVEQVMAMVRADAAKLLDEANLARGMYVKELGDHAFRRCWCLESLECFDILPLSNTSNVRVSVGEAWERSAPKRIKLKASAVLVGITLARFDSRAQDKFKEQAAKLYPGKTKRDIIITGKKEVRSEQGGRRALLAQVGVQVDYEVEGFESEEAVVEAVREVEEQIPELVTRLQAEKEFQQLVEINVFETPPAQGPGDGTCTDGRLNNEEVKVDCGGPDCPPCPCTADESHVCHMQAWCSATTEVQSFPTGAVIDPEIAQWPPASSTGRFECGCDAGFVGHGYGPQGCDGKAWAVRVVYQGVLASSLSTAGEANLLLLMGGLTCTRGTDGSEARCDHMHYAPTEGGLGVNVLFRASEAGHAAAEAAAVALNAALDTPAPQRRASAVPPEVDPRLGARVYRWTMGSAGSPVAVLPSGMEVEAVHFKADCAESGCWVLHLTYTTGSSDARLETFNTFFLPYAVGSDALSHDYTYSARVLDTFQPANFPCRVSDYVGIGGSVASLPVRATGCCFGTAFNASVSALGGDATGRGLLGRYRPTEAFASYAAYAYAELCPGGFDAPDIQTSGASPTPKPEEVFPDGRARAGSHHAGSFLAAGQRFVGMHASPGVVATRAMDAWVGHFEATIEVDERELRTRAGLLRGTIGVEHSVDFFLGFASLKPAATSWVLDSLATQTAIHVEKTSFFSVSTHGVNQYTFLEYVNLRLVAVYEEDGDLSGASEATNRTVRTNPEGAASYVQITFTLGSQYQPNMASGGLIPVDSVRAGTGTFFDEVDEAGGMQQVCSVFDAAPPSAEVGLAGYSDAKSKFMGLVGQGCGPQASMCTTPGSLPDKFVSYNIPLGFEVFANKASGDLSGNIFVDLVVNALDTDPSTGGGAGPTPNEGDDPMQMKTTLTASIPIVAGGINIFCDDLTAKTDLKDVANVDIIVGSAASLAELSRLRILEDVASTQLAPQGEVVVDSDSIEAGLVTLVLKGETSYFESPSLNTRAVSLELEDLISLHLMEADGRAADGSGSEGKQGRVKALLAEPPADDAEVEGGYSLNGAFYFTVDRGSQRAHLEPSARLLAECPFNAVRPAATGRVVMETCVARRDVRFRDFPWRAGAVSTAMELRSSADVTALPSGAASLEARFLASVIGHSAYTSQLAQDFAAAVDARYALNGRYRRAFWVNPGYEWAPTQTGGASLFQVSQKLFLFALVTVDEQLASSPGKSIYDEAPYVGAPEDINADGASETVPNLPRVPPPARRRALLVADPSSSDGAALSAAEVAFGVTRASLLATAFGVPPSHIATFALQLRLSEAEACMGRGDLQAQLTGTLGGYVAQTASQVETVQVLSLSVTPPPGLNCAGARRTSAGGGTAGVEMAVVFAAASSGPQPSLDLAAFAALPAIASVTPISVSDSIDVGEPGRAHSRPALEGPEEAEEGGASSIPLVAALGGGVGGACLLAALGAVLWLRSTRARAAAEQADLSSVARSDAKVSALTQLPATNFTLAEQASLLRAELAVDSSQNSSTLSAQAAAAEPEGGSAVC